MGVLQVTCITHKRSKSHLNYWFPKNQLWSFLKFKPIQEAKFRSNPFKKEEHYVDLLWRFFDNVLSSKYNAQISQSKLK